MKAKCWCPPPNQKRNVNRLLIFTNDVITSKQYRYRERAKRLLRYSSPARTKQSFTSLAWKICHASMPKVTFWSYQCNKPSHHCSFFRYYFIPVLHVPKAYYMTARTEVSLLFSLFNLLPLVLICFLMAAIAGRCICVCVWVCVCVCLCGYLRLLSSSRYSLVSVYAFFIDNAFFGPDSNFA